MILVNFIHLKMSQTFNVSSEQLNIPKYSLIEGIEYPYLFCVGYQIDIDEIIKSYGYEIGFRSKQKVYKNEFNSYHKTVFSYG